jgi:hypothetical protein
MNFSKSRKNQLLTPLILIASLCLAVVSRAESILIDDFKNGLRPAWKEKKFKGVTSYLPAVEDNIPCLKAEAAGTASGLFYEIEYDPAQKPILVWKWKVADIVKDGNELTKAGDDYAARIYVVFPAFFFWNTRALNYVWANRLPKGEAVANSYTANAMMIAVESGVANTGKWIEYRRNIYDDYRKYFGAAPGKVGAIAVMTDTDTTGGHATACYGPIYIESR